MEDDNGEKEQILSAIQKIEFRKEKSEDDELFEQFVPIILYDRLASNNTQIIYGRNGTGKTHLLKAFNFKTKRDYESERILSLYLDAHDFELGTSTQFTPEDLIKQFFKRLVQKVINLLKKHFESEYTINAVQRIFATDYKKRMKEINRSIREIDEILNYGRIEEKLKEFKREVSTSTSKSRKAGGSFKIGGNVSHDSQGVEAKGSAEVSGENSKAKTQAISQVFEGLGVIDYSEIREHLERIIENCGANSIFILIDEWSSINLRLQPLIAEMIKRTFCGSNQVSIKFVALKYFTRLSIKNDSNQPIGFQIGSDISVLADLDNLLTFDSNPQNVRDFLTLILFNHIKDDLDEDISIEKLERILIENIFESDLAYLELIRASEGNPRDFLTLLVNTTDFNNQNSLGVITKSTVINAASKYFTDNKEPVIEDFPEAVQLFKKIFQKLTSNRQKIFFISGSKIDRRINELWNYRFIHLLRENVWLENSEGHSGEYSIFSFDYGKLLSSKSHAKADEFFSAVGNIRKNLENLGISISAADGLYKVLLKFGIIDEGKIRKLIGTALFNPNEMEGSEERNIQELLAECLIDNLLLP